jgi:heme/copper-type cytochrome/quinol oxidase subunit 3
MTHTSLPWTYHPRPDTGTTNVRLGMWLFLASEAMLFGGLFSGYVLLRAGSPAWPSGEGMLSPWHAALATVIIAAAAAALAAGPGRGTRMRLAVSALLAAVFLAVKIAEYRAKIAAGLLPSSNLLLGCWYTLTAMHAVHVAAGGTAAGWLAGPGWRVTAALPDRLKARLEAVRLYWYFVDLVWLGILTAFYLV